MTTDPELRIYEPLASPLVSLDFTSPKNLISGLAFIGAVMCRVFMILSNLWCSQNACSLEKEENVRGLITGLRS